jgi:hypothetical protein
MVDAAWVECADAVSPRRIAKIFKLMVELLHVHYAVMMGTFITVMR